MVSRQLQVQPFLVEFHDFHHTGSGRKMCPDSLARNVFFQKQTDSLVVHKLNFIKQKESKCPTPARTSYPLPLRPWKAGDKYTDLEEYGGCALLPPISSQWKKAIPSMGIPSQGSREQSSEGFADCL